MSDTVVIDITAQITDRTAAGATSAIHNVSRLEQTMQRVQGEINKMSQMSRMELTMYAVDNASRVINNVMGLGRNIAGKVWRGTLKVLDFATAPIRGVINLLRNPVLQMAGIAGISIGTADMINTGANLEQSMANIRAISNMAQSEVNDIQRSFRDMAVDSGLGFSVNDIASAAKNFVTIDSSTDSILKKLGYAKTLSAASDMELYSTTYYLNTIMNKLGGNTELVSQAVDSMAMAATLAHQPLNNIMGSWNYMGSAVRNADMSMDEANAALVVLSDNGYRGSQAGTMFSRMMQDLMTPASTNAAAAIEELGFSMFDGEKNVRPFEEAMRDLANRLDRLETPYERINKLNDIFTINGARAADVILNNVDNLGRYIEAIENAGGAAAQMANARVDTQQGSFQRLRIAVDEFSLSIYDRAAPHLRRFTDWLTDRIPSATEIAVRAFDWAENKVDNLLNTIRGFTSTNEWANADFFGKIGIAWDNIIAQPFDEWWGSTGKYWLSSKANTIGRGIGSAINAGISALFGLDVGDAIDDGLSIGRSFADGFSAGIEGIDWGQVAGSLKDALFTAIRLVFSNPITGGIAGLWAGGKILGGISGAYKLGKGIKGAGASLLGTKTAGGLAQGLAINKATKGGGAAAQSALTFAQGGKLGLGAKIGSAGLGGMALGAAGVAGGVTAAVGLVDATTDLVRGLRADNAAERNAYVGSAAWKGGGIAAGATIGTLILPGVGTAIGAGVGYLGGRFMGNRRIRRHEEEMERRNEHARTRAISAGQARFESAELRQGVADLANGVISEWQFMSLKQSIIAEGISERFGTVNLSMREIQNLAENITFAGMHRGLSAFQDAASRAENSFANLKGMSDELDRMHWRVNLGIGYDADEYRRGIDTFVANAQRYIEDRQYEITLATRFLLGEDANMTGFNTAIASMQSEIDRLGSQLTAEFEIEGEINLTNIAYLRNQISEITSRIANAEHEGNLDMLRIRFGGDQLFETNADGILGLNQVSFERLQYELERNAEIARESIIQAYGSAFSGLRLELSKELIDKAEFNERFSELEQSYKDAMAGIDQRISDFLADEIGAKFGLAAGELTSAMQESIQNGFNPATWTHQQVYDFIGIESLEDGAAAQLAQMVNRLADGIPNLWDVAENRGLQGSFNSSKNANALREQFETWENRFSGGLSSLRDVEVLNPPSTPRSGGGSRPRNAEGGFFNSPELGWYGEDGPEFIIPVGSNRRQRGLALWERAGKMLGVKSAEGNEVFNRASTTGGTGGGGTGTVVPVTIQNVTFEISIDGNGAADTADIVEIIKANVKNLTDEIALNIAIALEQQFANTPLSAR